MNGLLEQLKRKVIPRDRTPLAELVADLVRPGKKRLSHSLEQLLVSINNNPCLNLTQRAKALDWYADRMQRAKEKLKEMGLVQESQLPKRKGRPSKYLVLTEEGCKYLGRIGEKPIPLHGSLRHHCLILKLRASYEKAYKTDMTKAIGDFRVDLWCEGKDKGAVEVVITNHVRRDLGKVRRLARLADWIHVVLDSENLLNHYKYTFGKELPRASLEKIRWSLLD